MRRTLTGIQRFLDDRLPVSTVIEFLHHQAYKRLPPHIGWLHTFGTLSLLLFLSQVATGVLLLVYYRPTAEEAHKSIQFITGEVRWGWFFRQLHAWGATLMTITVMVHMMRVFFMGSYKKPRELTWLVGLVLLVLTLAFGFTGYLLPWNQLSYWATTVGTEVAGSIPGIGLYLKRLMLGGDAVNADTLSRFFTLHVIVLPWALFFLIVLHLVLMRVQNLATLEPVGQERPYPPEAGIPFWPVHAAKEGCAAMLALGIFVTLTVVSPWEVGERADPLNTPEAIKPEWYFLPTYQLLKYFVGPTGKILGLLASTVPFILMVIWPFIDRTPARHPRQRPLAVTVGILGIVLALILGMLGYLSESNRTLFGRTYHFDTYGVPHLVQLPAAAAAQSGPAVETARPGETDSPRESAGGAGAQTGEN